MREWEKRFAQPIFALGALRQPEHFCIRPPYKSSFVAHAFFGNFLHLESDSGVFLTREGPVPRVLIKKSD